MNLKNGKVFTSKCVGTGPSSCGKRIYRAAVSQILRNTGIVASNRKYDQPDDGLEKARNMYLFLRYAISIRLIGHKISRRCLTFL